MILINTNNFRIRNIHYIPVFFLNDRLVAGDSNNQVHFEGYQVSNQCMALVRDNCLVPTIDAPELGYVKESTNEQYVPDVFYSVSKPVNTIMSYKWFTSLHETRQMYMKL